MTDRTPEQDTLQPISEQPEELIMGRFRCKGCQTQYTVNVSGVFEAKNGPYIRLTGVLNCTCRYQTPLEAEASVVLESLITTREAVPDLSNTAPGEVMASYIEARTCFYGTAYRATAAFCRSTGEEMLKAKGYTKNAFDDQIKDAKADGFIDDDLVMLAHGARLIGRNALHRNHDVTMAQALIALVAVHDFVSAVLPKPILAKRLGTNSK